MTEFKAVLPSEDGILLRPQLRKKLKLSRQKKVSKAISSIPPPSQRGRKKQDAAFRNRVGKKAQALRKVHGIKERVMDTIIIGSFLIAWLNA